MVVSYPEKYHQVILVPVNRAKNLDAQKAEEYLNSIYRQAVVQFRVLAVDSFFVSLNDKAGKLDNSDRNNRMDYAPEMKQVIRAWKKSPLYDPQAAYMFVLSGSVDPMEVGYMPLGRRFGFLFRNNRSEEELLHTLAHELGHGLFTLRHTFSSSNRVYQPQTVTTNLMSYGPPSSTRLYKYQWDQIQNPSLALFSWMEKEEEGELSLPCLGLFDDCHFVIAMLDSLRNCRIRKEKLTIKSEKSRYTGKFLKIGNVDYDCILIDFNQKGSIESDPSLYSSYDKDFMDEYNK
ncbi:MAG: hypothetical protein ACPLXM_14675, partial [Bacteroidales bacterium]